MDTATATAAAPAKPTLQQKAQQATQKGIKKQLYQAAGDHAKAQGWLEKKEWGTKWDNELKTYVLNPLLTTQQKENALKAATVSLRGIL